MIAAEMVTFERFKGCEKITFKFLSLKLMKDYSFKVKVKIKLILAKPPPPVRSL